jgi:hypothetical protein
MDTAKEIVFKTKVTPKVGGLASVPICAAIVLFYFAVDAGSKFGENDPTRYIFIGIPALIATILLLTVLLVCNHFLGRTITIRDNKLVYEDAKGMMTLELTEMAFSPPPEGATLRTLMFSDGATFVQIPQLFLGEKGFEQLNKLIKDRRRNRETESQKTYSL